jgi:hypothetical protein
MYHQEWLPKDWEFAPEPSNVGRRKAKLKRTEPKADREDTTSIQLSLFDFPPNQPSFTRLVSSHSQKSDLERQIEFLVSSYPGCEVIKDIGSGLNFKRKGLLALLERILSGDVGMVVVANKDRLCRFGFDLVSWLAERSECKVLVLNNHVLSPEREMLEDVLAIIDVFSCKLYGLRKYKQKIKEDPDLQSLSKGRNQKGLDA